MAAKKKSSLRKLIGSALVAIPEIARFINNITELVKTQASAIIQKISTLIVLSILAVILINAAWLSVCVMLFAYLLTLQIHPIICIFSVFMLNMLLLAIVGIAIINTKNRLH